MEPATVLSVARFVFSNKDTMWSALCFVLRVSSPIQLIDAIESETLDPLRYPVFSTFVCRQLMGSALITPISNNQQLSNDRGLNNERMTLLEFAARKLKKTSFGPNSVWERLCCTTKFRGRDVRAFPVVCALIERHEFEEASKLIARASLYHSIGEHDASEQQQLRISLSNCLQNRTPDLQSLHSVATSLLRYPVTVPRLLDTDHNWDRMQQDQITNRNKKMRYLGLPIV